MPRVFGFQARTGFSPHIHGTGRLALALTLVKTRIGSIVMPRENDLEGVQDQGGKHGGQKGMPKPEPKPPRGPDQGIVRDEKGQEQPRDKERAQRVHRTDTVR